MSIYVGNLSYNVTQDELKEVFEDYGNVKNEYIYPQIPKREKCAALVL